MIVLHYTATSTYSPVFNTFAANSPSLGEQPGVCSQFVVEKDGTIHQLTRLYVRCRHTIGLNHRSIGIEMVQEGRSRASTAADRAILDRKKQIRSATKLTAWLKQRYRIKMQDVIGHAMANDSPKFKDLEGWKNDHVDWLRRRRPQVPQDRHQGDPQAPMSPERRKLGARPAATPCS